MAAGCSMPERRFHRPAHEAVAGLLRRFDRAFLDRCACLFAGGAAATAMTAYGQMIEIRRQRPRSAPLLRFFPAGDFPPQSGIGRTVPARRNEEASHCRRHQPRRHACTAGELNSALVHRSIIATRAPLFEREQVFSGFMRHTVCGLTRFRAHIAPESDRSSAQTHGKRHSHRKSPVVRRSTRSAAVYAALRGPFRTVGLRARS